MTPINFKTEAELYPARRRGKGSIGYKRFPSLARAVQFAIEELPGELLLGTYLESEERRYDKEGIRALYDSAAYPLKRRRLI